MPFFHSICFFFVFRSNLIPSIFHQRIFLENLNIWYTVVVILPIYHSLSLWSRQYDEYCNAYHDYHVHREWWVCEVICLAARWRVGGAGRNKAEWTWLAPGDHSHDDNDYHDGCDDDCDHISTRWRRDCTENAKMMVLNSSVVDEDLVLVIVIFTIIIIIVVIIIVLNSSVVTWNLSLLI